MGDLVKIREVELSHLEQSMVKASDQKIRDLQPELVTKQLGVVYQFLCKDLGVSNTEDYYKIRFVQVVFRYFSGLSVAEIKLAFELFILGELDAFANESNNRTVNKDHYGRFNIKYVMRVLTAYNRRKNRLILKLEDGNRKYGIAEEKKIELEKAHLDNVHTKFLAYVNEGKRPEFYFPKLVVSTLHRRGIIDQMPNVEGKPKADLHAYYTDCIVQVFKELEKLNKSIYDYDGAE